VTRLLSLSLVSITQAKVERALGEFSTYFSEWRHIRLLFDTLLCWFLLDISFHGINLKHLMVR